MIDKEQSFTLVKKNDVSPQKTTIVRTEETYL